MDISAQMEAFSLGYIKTLIAAAGFKHSIENVDDDSVDITVSGKGFQGHFRNPKIDIQVKSTYTDCLNDDVLKYSLKKKNYNDLRGSNVTSPRYLVVLKLPSKDPSDWLKLESDSISLYNYCYWCSLRNEEESSNTSSITISIPANQVLTIKSLQVLMSNASNGVVE